MSASALDRFAVQAGVSGGFATVRDVFVENFVRRRELGGACCAYRRGEKSISGVVFVTRKRASHGSRTRWSSYIRPPKVCPQ
jgi:hypothetical protein